MEWNDPVIDSYKLTGCLNLFSLPFLAAVLASSLVQGFYPLAFFAGIATLGCTIIGVMIVLDQRKPKQQGEKDERLAVV